MDRRWALTLRSLLSEYREQSHLYLHSDLIPYDYYDIMVGTCDYGPCELFGRNKMIYSAFNRCSRGCGYEIVPRAHFVS